MVAQPGVLANDGPGSGTALTALLIIGPSHGALSLDQSGSFAYTPTANFNGTDGFTYRARSDIAESGSATVTFSVGPVNDAPSFAKGPDLTAQEDAGQQMVPNWATDLSAGPPDEAIQSLTFLVSNSNNALFSAQPAISPDGTLTYTPAPDGNGNAVVTVRLRDSGGTANGGADTSADQTFAITVAPVDEPPPDPGTVAPPIDRSVATDLAGATAFLYGGSNPIQTGVAPGTIEPRRAAVVRGKVTTRAGQPLPLVAINVLGHPEFGQTLSRADGMFDLAVNGGGILTIHYAKSGFLPAQRQVRAPWQDFAVLPDVALIPLDPHVTSIELTAAAPMQVARGSAVTDGDGTRQATLLVPNGTTAELSLPDGTRRALNTLRMRATEYTVGPTGPAAMPAELPPTSGYTYAAELSVDEAIEAGATSVLFNRPVPFVR